MYHGKRVSAQGTFDPMQMMDIGLKKDLFDKKLSLTLRVSDVFNTAKFRANLFGDNFSETFERVRDSRALFLNISYKFGQQEKKQEKRKKGNNENEQENDDGFGF